MADPNDFGIKTRRPTGAVPWPLILLEGEDKAGKSWAAAQFTAHEGLGERFWIDVGEGAADEYYAIPGADYLVIEHDGTFDDILAQVRAVRRQAASVDVADGGKPTLLVIDSMTNIWQQLKEWTHQRAQKSRSGQRQRAADPDAPVRAAPTFWNDTHARNQTLMDLLMTFPGIVVITARGKEVSAIGDDGNPIEGQREWKVEASKNIGFESTGWVRLRRTEPPTVVGVRSVHAGIRPGVDKPLVKPDFSLEWLIFDYMRCDPASAYVRDLKVSEESTLMKIDAATDLDTVEEVTKEFRAIYGRQLRVERAAAQRWRYLKALREQAAAEGESSGHTADSDSTDTEQAT
ncbi:hypothetical protein [Nocardia terpenica]|uniref:Uncharacterized protein n=1 Tax=Nocardia terpenica TaxID=455432 RepID=A0A164H0X4_9NOCA|nr:hypothetical protein [Nocardia terpenica]KZM68108.1 hypothetical protein AWN90_09205 [Nocardia terpenica]NQE89034.1 hypothetical protein [Nocardia terpenica]